MKKQMAVDEIDIMVDDVVSSPIAGAHEDDDLDDSEPEQTVTRAGRTVKPVTQGLREPIDKQGKDAGGSNKPPSTILKLKISTPLRTPAPKKEDMENSTVFQATPAPLHPMTSGKDLSLLNRNSPQMLVWDPTMTAAPAKEAIISKSKPQKQPRRLLPKLSSATGTPTTPHQQLVQVQPSTSESQQVSNIDHNAHDVSRLQKSNGDVSSTMPAHFDPQSNSF